MTRPDFLPILSRRALSPKHTFRLLTLRGNGTMFVKIHVRKFVTNALKMYNGG